MTASELPDDPTPAPRPGAVSSAEETEKLLSEPVGTAADTITLSTGTTLRILPMKTRELLKLMKIITHGAGNALGAVAEAMRGGEAVNFSDQLIALIVVALPDAEDEVIEFLQAVTIPADTVPNPPDKKTEQENIAKMAALWQELRNPEIEDTVAIITKLITNEAADIQSLGKQLANSLSLATKVGVTKT